MDKTSNEITRISLTCSSLYYAPVLVWTGAIDALARALHKICLHSTGADTNLILSILSNFMHMSSCLFGLSINLPTVGSFVMEQQCWVVPVLALNASCQC